MNPLTNIIEKFLTFLNSIPEDKVKHSFYGTLIYIILFFVTTTIIKLHGMLVEIELSSTYCVISVLTLMLTAAIGYIKEIYDKFHSDRHKYDLLDFVFTIIYPLLITIIICLVE